MIEMNSKMNKLEIQNKLKKKFGYSYEALRKSEEDIKERRIIDMKLIYKLWEGKYGL